MADNIDWGNLFGGLHAQANKDGTIDDKVFRDVLNGKQEKPADNGLQNVIDFLRNVGSIK